MSGLVRLRLGFDIPGTGYVGVGRVTGQRCRTDQYELETTEVPRTLVQMALTKPYPNLDSTPTMATLSTSYWSSGT